ncbi:MAG: M15 family metallopeptidase [Erysipelotrichaceae bacterium]|nr:M15 family metallopeptidase [Erysipelotrichaceae bacterium]
MTANKKKRKLNGKFVALVAAVLLLCLSAYKVPHFINVNRLLDMGYSEEAVSAIYKKGLRRTILKNEYYSDYLNEEIVKDSFNKKYLRLYVLTDHLDEDCFELYEMLKARKGYSDEELESLYAKLKIYELKPLLVFDKLDDTGEYIEDCLRHPDNSETVFEVDGDYLHPYENYIEIAEDKADAVDVYVSSKSFLGNYEPLKLVEINSINSIPGAMMESRALAAFYEMCEAIRKEDLDMAVYATGGYVSYEDQAILNGQNPSRFKAGFSDDQTGLTVYVTNEENSSFKETRSYAWLMENAYKYGFIQRFPEGKEALTGHAAMPNYFRYVGTELAEKIRESGLCFDEYYFTYLN